MEQDKKDDLSLLTPIGDLEQRMMEEDNFDELKNIIDLFNLNIKKKDIIRVNRLNELQDKITSQMEERLEKRANEFSNKDLLDYFKVVQDTINKNDTTLENVNAPTIQIHQNNVIVENGELDYESKRKVASVVDDIMKKIKMSKAQEQLIEIDETEIIVEEENDDNTTIHND